MHCDRNRGFARVLPPALLLLPTATALADAAASETSAPGRQRLWMAIAALGLLGAALLLRHLRRQVRALRDHEIHRTHLQQRYDQLVERAVDVIYTLDEHGRVLEMNRAGMELFGRDADNYRGRSVLEIVVPEHRDQVRQRIARRFAAREGDSPFTTDVIDGRGERRTLEVTSRVVRTVDGRSQIEAVARDITVRHRVEKALVALVAMSAGGSGEAFLQRVVRCTCETLGTDIALIGLHTPDEPVQIRTIAAWVDGAPGKILEYPLDGSPCAVVGRERVLSVPDALQDRFPHARGPMDSGVRAYLGLRLEASDGRTLGVLATLHRKPFQPSQHELQFLEILAARIGAEIERRQTEQALREKEIHYENIVEALGEGVLVADRSGRFLRANASAIRILGLNPSGIDRIRVMDESWEVIRDDGSRMLPADFPAVRTLETGEPSTQVAMGVRRPDGERRWLKVNTRPLRDPAGSDVAAVVISFVDDTEARQNRIELERARDAAEASDRAKADFLTVISHEVRTPLNAVLGYADLLEQEMPDADLKRYVRTIRQSGENLLEIINDILEFSKLEAGRLRLENEPYDLLETAYGVAELLSARAASKGLTLAFDWEPDVPRDLSGDANRVRQILTNLVGNAVKFTSAGHVLVSAGLVAGSNTSPPRIRIRVEDTGPGIPEEKHSLLFQRFSMVDSSLTRRHGGTGLGLAISRQLAEAMGGCVGFSSVAGHGSTFWFEIPIPPSAPPRNLSPGAPPGTRLILATRHPLASRLIGRHCRHWGIELIPTDSAEAVRILAESTAPPRPVAAVLADGPLAADLAAATAALGLPVITLLPPPMSPASRAEPEVTPHPALLQPFLHPDRLAQALDLVLSPESRGPQTPGNWPGTASD